MFSPNAYYDTLFIIFRRGQARPGPTEFEVHLIAYLACLLSLYDGKASASWGYRIALTEGRPFSADIQQAINVQRSRGAIEETVEGSLMATSPGSKELANLGALRILSAHDPYIAGACSAALTQPTGIMAHALLHDVQLGPLHRLGSSRLLFDGPSVQLMHKQFQEIKEGIGVEPSELMIPATVWLAFFDHVARLRASSPDGGADVEG